jgi:N-acetylmuramoyl-L-alanine amidase
MSLKIKRRAALGAMGAGLLGRFELAHGATLVAVRVWPAAEYTRVTLESDTALSVNHFLTDNPNRLVIDIDGLELSPALRELVSKVRADDPFIGGIRVGQNQPRVVRLVIDLKQSVAPQLFTLEPVAAYKHRLVFDLYPTTAQNPLQALLGEKQKSDQAEQDALGTFIDQVGKPPSVPPVVVTPPKPVVSTLTQSKINRLIIVAIDAGHGGEDSGALGPSGLREKDVVLALALKLRDSINTQPGMRAMLTRDADFFVPLQDRVQKARSVQADLFVSIHADAFITPQAHGASVFALSQRGASSTAARWMATKENAADLVGGVNIKAKDKAVLRTLIDMSTAAQIKDSLKLATQVLGEIGKVGDLHKAHVEQAGFAVLKAPDIPSILVETAFISNPDEEAKLRDADYQKKFVAAITQGIKRYFAKSPLLARNRQL